MLWLHPMLNVVEYRVTCTAKYPRQRVFQRSETARRYADKQAKRDEVTSVVIHFREVDWWEPVARIVDGFIEYHDIDPKKGVSYEYAVRYRRKGADITSTKTRHFETEAAATDFINEKLLGGDEDKWADLPELADVRVERRRTGPWAPMF